MVTLNITLVLYLLTASAWAKGPVHGCFISDDYPKNGDVCFAERVGGPVTVVIDRRNFELPEKCSPNLGGRAFVDMRFEDVRGQERQLRSNEYTIPDDDTGVWKFKFAARYQDVRPDTMMHFVEQLENGRIGRTVKKKKSVRYVTNRSAGSTITRCPSASW